MNFHEAAAELIARDQARLKDEDVRLSESIEFFEQLGLSREQAVYAAAGRDRRGRSLVSLEEAARRGSDKRARLTERGR